MIPEVGQLRYSSENLHGNLELIWGPENIQFSYVPMPRSAVEGVSKVSKHPVPPILMRYHRKKIMEIIHSKHITPCSTLFDANKS